MCRSSIITIYPPAYAGSSPAADYDAPAFWTTEYPGKNYILLHLRRKFCLRFFWQGMAFPVCPKSSFRQSDRIS